MLYGAAAEHGVPAILAESGGRGLVEEETVVRHVNGAHLADITSPAKGIILFTLTSPAIKRGGLLLAVGVPED